MYNGRKLNKNNPCKNHFTLDEGIENKTVIRKCNKVYIFGTVLIQSTKHWLCASGFNACTC